MVSELSDIELELKKQVLDFTIMLFSYFRQQFAMWDRFISIVAEIDCLTALSCYSFLQSA